MLFNISSLIVLLEECQCNEWSPQRRCTEVSNSKHSIEWGKNVDIKNVDILLEECQCNEWSPQRHCTEVSNSKHFIEWGNFVSYLFLRTVKKTRTSSRQYSCLKICIACSQNKRKGLQRCKSILADFNNSDYLVELNKCMIPFLHYCKIFSFLNAFLENQEKTPDIWCFASA